MKTNLSSKIKLEHISKKLYNPENEIELASIARMEKVYTRIFESVADGCEYIADLIVKDINKYVEEKGKCVLSLGTGNNTDEVYSRLVEKYQRGEVSFKNVVVYSLNEYFPLQPEGPSTMRRLKENLLDHVDIKQENIHTFIPFASKEDIFHYCRDYEKKIADDGGIDVVVCGIGRDGSLAFNSPGTTETSKCRIVALDMETRQNVMKDYGCPSMPETAITLGIGDILRSKRVLAISWGENRAGVIEKMVEGPVTSQVPASFLQKHSHTNLVVDIAAASDLTRISKPWKVTSCEWSDKLIRRAIVSLCYESGKPILKLTDKDYNDGGLGELLAIYNSAYNVNIKIFNDLQHTITGWPGGKPMVDDTYRPERAFPYPKRVLVFSPHPDDDVISMGGTLKRLVDQDHDVYVAYQTSGNIAVGDEDLVRYLGMMDSIVSRFGCANAEYGKKTEELYNFLKTKKAGDPDPLDIRFLKTKIRQGEAKLACKYIGVKPENIYFLNLPFYETGTVKKNNLSEKDLDIVRDLITKIKPHEIFVAGDLADPHGTHRICTDAVLAVIDEQKDEEWMKDCRIWMYRGAWAEWEIDHIEMAVPLSPEELRFKRNSILKHQSQMENAPFLGNDDRLFWQRSEARNKSTAEIYHKLGLACYEAIEAFVQYHPIRH